jgi:zinc and cadmium transporter
MTTWTLTLLSVAAVGLVSLVGLATVSANPARVRQMAELLVSFAVGTLLGDAFIHLIPQAFADTRAARLEASLLVLGGMMLFFLVEKLLRHGHGPLHDYYHPEEGRRPELAAVNLLGDAVQNFIDGALIAASYLVSPELGFSTTVAVVFHEIPQELGDFGVLVHSGLSIRQAVLLNLASASVAILGAVSTLAIGAAAGAGVSETLVPVTAGGFVYIAAADLIPELQHDRSLRGLFAQASLIAAGIAVMAALSLVE